MLYYEAMRGFLGVIWASIGLRKVVEVWLITGCAMVNG